MFSNVILIYLLEAWCGGGGVEEAEYNNLVEDES